jgi:arginine/lysine/ornithine decarboxylase
LLSLFGSGAWAHDLTELDGLDYLSAPRGAIAEAQALAARAFGAAHTWFLVNGTTVGVHAAVLAACRPGDAVVLGRNCHARALAACALAGVVPFFAEAATDASLGVAHAVTPAAAAAALDAAAAACAAAPRGIGRAQPRVALLLVVSPTYFGASADVAGLAREAHARGVPLAVDEAHGPHLSFAAAASAQEQCDAGDRAALSALPQAALAAGADVAVQSTHKTLPALTQAAMLHCAAGGRVPPARLAAALQLLQSSSPSYLLLASLDAARAHAATGAPLAAAVARACQTRAELAKHAPALRVLGPPDVGRDGVHALDITRLTVGTSGLGAASGYAAAALLAQEGVTPELVAPRCVVFVIAAGTTRDDVARLVRALARLAAAAPPPGTDAQDDAWPQLPPAPAAAMSPRRAAFARRERVAFAAAVGRISADTLCPYPPVRHAALLSSAKACNVRAHAALLFRLRRAFRWRSPEAC